MQYYTVKPLNNDHIGDGTFILFSEVVFSQRLSFLRGSFVNVTICDKELGKIEFIDVCLIWLSQWS